MEKSKPANTFEWAQRINENEYYLTGISLSELGDLLADVRKAKQKAENFAISVNPPLDPRRQSSHWIEADFIEAAVLKELKDRQQTKVKEVVPPTIQNIAPVTHIIVPAQDAPPRKRTPAKKETADLPALNEVVKDAETFLPKLWEALAGMPAPLVSKSGIYIWAGENVSVLMALAQALKTADKILGDNSTEQVYRILCRHFNTPEAKRPRIKAKTETGFTNAYFDCLSDLNDSLEGL